jgi:hypothetical protein
MSRGIGVCAAMGKWVMSREYRSVLRGGLQTIYRFRFIFIYILDKSSKTVCKT